MTRLETRSKESNVYVSFEVVTLINVMKVIVLCYTKIRSKITILGLRQSVSVRTRKVVNYA
jgi:hypothetical protein